MRSEWGDILITADTVVICGGRIFGKPDGREGRRPCWPNCPAAGIR